MAANGSLSWDLSAAMVLGSNIGSTVDAVMSSMGASVNARRTADVHVAFNVTGTILALCVFHPFLKLVDLVVPGTPQSNITTHIAMLHTIFNITATLLFLPFIKQIAILAQTFIKESKKEVDSHYKVPAILPVTHISADLYSFQIQKEITKMAGRVMGMFDLLSQALNSDKEISDELVNSIAAEEDFIDEMNHGITDFLQKCSRLPNANHKDRNNFARLISVTQNLEDLSDECCSMIHTICKFKNKEEVEIFKKHLSELNLYFGQVYVFFEQTCTYIALGISDEDKFLSSEVEEKIDRTKKQLKKESRKRIEDGSDVKAELNFMDLVRKIEKAGDCVFGVVQSLSSNLEESVVNESSEGLLKAQNIIVNPKTHKVFASGKEVKLAGKEYDLLLLLLERKGELISRDEILKSVWEYDSDIESRTLDVHIRMLRQKLNNQKIIETVRGVGYRLK